MKTKYMIVGLLAVGSLAMGQKVSQRKRKHGTRFAATTPDAKIAAVDSLISKFKDTRFKSPALMMAGDIQRKGDAPNSIVYGNRALEADPKNFQAMLLVSGQLAQMTKEFDLDKDEKLKQASKLANEAITTINAAPKPNPQLPDDQWAAIKKDMVSQAHETLGVIASIDKKWDTAITEFKTAIDEAAHPEPSTMVRLTATYNVAMKYDEAGAMADKVC
jgi:hypothetical protein